MTSSEEDTEVRRAGVSDAATVGRMLDEFNREFDDPTPGPEFMGGRIEELLEVGEVTVFLIGDGPDGLSLLRFRPTLWANGDEAYLEELYVVPPLRGKGLGRALMERSIAEARERGCGYMSIATGETDTAARALYESCGFRNTESGPDGPAMLYYERELDGD